MKKCLMLLVLLLSLCLLFGCDNNKEKTIKSISLDETSIPNEITAYDFDLSTIKLICKYSDDSVEYIALNESMFDTDNLSKLNTVGEQTIACTYNGNAYIFNVNVVKGDPSLYIIESINVTITTVGKIYSVTALTQKNVSIYATASTNTDLLTATLTITVSPEFTYSNDLVINCTLDLNKIELKNIEINNNKVSAKFDDAFWSPLA